MARERIISADAHECDEDVVGQSLRPRSLSEMVGQQDVIQQLQIAIQAARKRREPLEHILLDGPPGLGKTTLAHVIAHEMNASTPRITSGPVLNKSADLMSVLTTIETGEFLFIDEIHRLPRPVEEFMYPAMEDFRVDYILEGGLGGRTVNFTLNRFTLIGATTRAGMLSSAMRERFGIRYHLTFYDEDELCEILTRSANKLGIEASSNALQSIARRSRGTPRVANRLLRRVRDYAQVIGDGIIREDLTAESLEVQGVDSLGLDALDRAYLLALINIYRGGPAGIEALAASMGQERDTLEDVVEPYLLQLGFVIRTRQGREATHSAYKHLNLPIPQKRPSNTQQSTLFDE